MNGCLDGYDFSAKICVTYKKIGYHKWAGASGKRSYLAFPHRHLFHYRVTISVEHDDREIEFHDFLEFCQENSLDGDMGGLSCENMAVHLAELICDRYPRRSVQIEVSEDGEVSAIIDCQPARKRS